MTHHKRQGFTLIELLVAIAIIGILIGMLLPAVQMVRESARLVQCKNNVKQQSLAMLNYESSFRKFPSGGWGYNWVGDPDRGGLDQPGGWIFSILPYLEENNLHDEASDGKKRVITIQQMEGTSQMIQTPVETMICPSRRAGSNGVFTNAQGWDPRNMTEAPGYSGTAYDPRARSDYAVNAGDYIEPTGPPVPPLGGPLTLADGDNPSFPWPDMKLYTGICYRHTQRQLRDIRDGQSNTIMIGEKYLGVDDYETGLWKADNECMYVGADIDVNRWTLPGTQPLQDSKGFSASTPFGSSHPGVCVFAFNDGSVHSIPLSIDSRVYQNLGNRKDGNNEHDY